MLRKVEIKNEEFMIYNRIFVMSDLHGNYEMFLKMLNEIFLTKSDLLIINGDICDRGDSSHLIFEKIIELKNENYKILCNLGNHEEMMVRFYDKKDDFYLWFLNGGKKTYINYEMNPDLLKNHLSFIRKFYHYIEFPDIIVVHAGFNPNLPLEFQKTEDMLWIRDKFLRNDLKFIKKKVIFGHTITKSGEIEKYENNTIGVDCGSYINNKLGCIEIKTNEVFYVFL